MKYSSVIIISILILGLISACGTPDTKSGDTEQKAPVSDSIETDGDVIMIDENSFTFSFEQEENIDGLFNFTLKNVSNNDKPIELVFSSSQEIDYVISDLDENELYQYSKENFFTEAMMYKTIVPNEEYVVNVDFRDVFSSLGDEDFDIEIWTVAKGINARAKTRVTLN